MFTIRSYIYDTNIKLMFPINLQLGPTHVQFVERRIMFGQVPVNLCTTRTVLLANTGTNHAYFQVWSLQQYFELFI